MQISKSTNISSIVNEVIRTISSQFIFFYENAQIRKSNQNQLTKQKQANKKQQRQQFFERTKASKRVKVVCFAFLCAQNLFVTSFTILLRYTPTNCTRLCSSDIRVNFNNTSVIIFLIGSP